MSVRVYTFAIPAVAIMDYCSDAVDFPLWAYFVLFIACLIRIVHTRY